MTFLKSAATAFAMASVCLPAMAQQTKIATILAMQAGDVACYLTLRDDDGKQFRDLADFEICEQQSLLNKRVTLTYRRGNVMADECQGNPECKKSKSVMLVVSARPVAVGPETPRVAASLCAAGETVVFSCGTGGSMVSVCAAGGAQGSLQYRFGVPGQKPEMVVPDPKVVPARAATGEAVPFSGGGGAWLRFKSGTTNYVVYTGIGNWGPGGAKKEIAGIVVEAGGKRTANVQCMRKPTSELGPDLFQKLGIKSGGQDFEFPTNN